VGSLAIASGSFDPAVNTRRRENRLPASRVSWPVAASFHLLGPPSRPLTESQESAHSPPEKTLIPSTRPPESVENSPTLDLQAETRSYRITDAETDACVVGYHTLPASLVSPHLSAPSRTLRPTLSASPPPPRERPQPALKFGARPDVQAPPWPRVSAATREDHPPTAQATAALRACRDVPALPRHARPAGPSRPSFFSAWRRISVANAPSRRSQRISSTR
jgi:hypothetical protein